MDRVATPQPLAMPSSPQKTGTLPRQMLSMIPVLEAQVLSVGMYITSLLSAALAHGGHVVGIGEGVLGAGVAQLSR